MQQTTISANRLERGMGLRAAISANVLNMVGVGPFLTIPLALAAMGGPQAMVGWVLGAVISLSDGMVWAELGSRFPDSGGPYFFLLHAFGERGPGRLFAFLFLFQSLLAGPISIASGAVGFASYATVFHPLSHVQLGLMAMLLCLANIALLVRSIRAIGAISVVVTAVVVATCLWIIFAGATHFQSARAFDFPAGAFHLTRGFWMGLGASTLIATYDFGGYGTVCLLGGEISHPRRTIPRALIGSILLVALLYLAMNLAIVGVLPWRQETHSSAIVADLMMAVYGSWAAKAVSALILIAAWGSAYTNLLGYSRVPYAAAVEGSFPSIFGRIRKRDAVPLVSLSFMGLASAALCFLSLDALIASLILVQVLLQFVAQCVAVMVLRAKDPARDRSLFRMPLFPLPALVALAGWIYVAATSGTRYLWSAGLLSLCGVALYCLQANRKQEWPFRHA